MKLYIGRLKDFYHYKDLIGQLVSRDLKLKYRRSILGYLWSILNPLLVMLVMVLVFSKMFDNNIKNYPVYLISGQVIFNYMRNSTTQAMNSIIGNGSLLKKAYVPKYIFTVSKVTSGLVDFLFSLGSLLLVMFIMRTPFSIHILFFPIIALQLYVFCIGLGMFLAQAAVFFRDLQYIYSVIITVWMYLTPMFYPMERLNESLQYVIRNFNPMYFYVEQFRSLVLYQTLPDVGNIIRGLIAMGITIFIGIYTFLRSQDKFILYI